MKKIALLAMSAMCVLALAGCNKSKGPSEAALKAAENGDYSKLPVAKDPASKIQHYRSLRTCGLRPAGSAAGPDHRRGEGLFHLRGRRSLHLRDVR